jgi:hypothetical protein
LTLKEWTKARKEEQELMTPLWEEIIDETTCVLRPVQQKKLEKKEDCYC